MINQLFLFAVAVDPNQAGVPNNELNQDTITTGLQIVTSITAAAAFLMIVFAGLKFVASRGDSNAVATARKTALYAVIGLIVSVLAFLIVTFVMGNL